MKKLTIYLVNTLTVIFFASCSKSFLDVPISGKIEAESYVKDLNSSQNFLSGIYLQTARDAYNYNVVIYADAVADNVNSLSFILNTQFNWVQQSDETGGYSTNMNKLWLDGYNIIRQCNFLIERVGQFRNEDPVKADAIQGQAYALRALMHYNLLNVFAQPYHFTSDASHPGIPYDTLYSQSQAMKRQSVKEIYDAIIADFTRAKSLIPESVSTFLPINILPQSVFSQDAISGLMARIYLFKKDYLNAKNLAVEVCSRHSLMEGTDYETKLFTDDDEEALVWFAPFEATNTASIEFAGYLYSIPSFFSASSDLVSLIAQHPNDKRNKWFSLTPDGAWQVTKFPQGAVPEIANGPSAYFQTVIRSSELFLTASECFANLGEEDNARFYLDKIRQRADESLPASTASGTALLDSIKTERRKELCFENLRMYDLQRLAESVIRKETIPSAPATLVYPNNKAIAPIPALDVRTYKFEQNAGY